MVFARVNLTEYANTVINVVKARFRLKDKSEAINRLIQLCGEEFVEKEPKDIYVKKILELAEKHEKKYSKRKMSLQELDALRIGE